MIQCRACGAPIRWVRTTRGKSMPLDAEPDPTGNVTIEGGVAVVHGQPPITGPVYMPHHATCPNWKRP